MRDPLDMSCEKCGIRYATNVHYIYWKEKPLRGNHRIISKEHPEWFQKLCILCHAEIHGTSPNMSELKNYVILRNRSISIKSIIERHIIGFSRCEMIVPIFWIDEYDRWNEAKEQYTKKLELLLKENDSKLKKFLFEIPGVDVVTVAYVLAYLPKELIHPRKLRAYWGLDPTHMQRRRGASEEENKKCGLSIMKSQLLGIVAGNLKISQKKHSGTPLGKYYDIYKEEKVRQQNLHPELKKIHIEKRAKRKMIEMLVNDIFYIAKNDQNQSEQKG